MKREEMEKKIQEAYSGMAPEERSVFFRSVVTSMGFQELEMMVNLVEKGWYKAEVRS